MAINSASGTSPAAPLKVSKRKDSVAEKVCGYCGAIRLDSKYACWRCEAPASEAVTKRTWRRRIRPK